jgi:hypothetical protein
VTHGWELRGNYLACHHELTGELVSQEIVIAGRRWQEIKLMTRIGPNAKFAVSG